MTEITGTRPSPGGRIYALLNSLYGTQIGTNTGNRVFELCAQYRAALAAGSRSPALTERDALLITYADHVSEPGVPPLRSLAAFCKEKLAGVVSGIHILPFYPWTSDDGFSVKDFFAVSPDYGNWDDIAQFLSHFDLMFDAVFNHMSAQSDWFQRFLRDEPDFRDFFVIVPGNPDLSQVVRPRALPLLTEFQSARGREKLWTTFSADQVDVNARNPRVLLALLEALLFYVAKGARFIRLDAIAYLWKEIGTTCIHLPQTHTVIQLMRAVLDEVAPQVQLITETNVPHLDNISYFGDGQNEAQLVYNFALPPLVLHALLRSDATYLTRWAATLRSPSDQTSFFNFLASHDGIGLNPARGILPAAEIEYLVGRCQVHGGLVNYKHNADGSQSPYEMNIVYFDAINDPGAADSREVQVNRFMVAQAIMLAFAGMPGIYFHSLFGSRNDREAALRTGINRRINRQKFSRAELERALGSPDSICARVFNRFVALLKARRSHGAFNPRATQTVCKSDPRIFAVLRAAATDGDWVLCLHNVSSEPVKLAITQSAPGPTGLWQDLLSGTKHAAANRREVDLVIQPFEASWLAGDGSHPTNVCPVE